jgi:hypothetical protein
LPVVKNVPPLDALYQSITAPGEAAANNVTIPLPQRDDDVLDDTEGNACTFDVWVVASADWQVTPPVVTLTFTVAVTAPSVDVSKV